MIIFETSIKYTRGTTQIAIWNRLLSESNNSYAFTQQSRGGSNCKSFLPPGSEATDIGLLFMARTNRQFS